MFQFTIRRIIIFCSARHCYSVLTDRVTLYFVHERERERETEKPRKTFAQGVGKKPEKENVLSISFDKIITNGPSTFIPLLLGQTRLLRYPSRATVCFFSPSFPSKTSNVDPDARRIPLFRQQRSPEHPSCGIQIISLVKICFNDVDHD